MTQRKTDHIQLAAASKPVSLEADQRFNYEPLLNAHPNEPLSFHFFEKKIEHPLWISSMTGGSAEANRINHLLAEACAEFGMGMGLGSCRSLLRSNEFLDDFNLRPIIGDKLPFYANLGIAQLEELLEKKEFDRVTEMVVNQLKADGLFIHVNPTQEWLQPEGDLFKRPALETVAEIIEQVGGEYKLIVKEVGQGMGPESLEQLLKLPINGLEFGAFGGTNFAKIEIMRNKPGKAVYKLPLANIGHNANEMVEMINEIGLNHKVNCQQIIVSGGLKNFLDGYYYIQKASIPAVYGMAGVVLEHAMQSKENLFHFLQAEKEGYAFAEKFLRIKK
jgi:isopentenyl-diphosphate delta-isomerase